MEFNHAITSVGALAQAVPQAHCTASSSGSIHRRSAKLGKPKKISKFALLQRVS
jgi:hypothetical protein